MKIIFLDIDGVLNHWASLAESIHMVNSKCVLLKRICEATGAKIVLSSTWRIGEIDPKALNHMIWRCGGPYNTIIDFTAYESKNGKERGYEIEDWLKKRDDIEAYVIIDDDSDMLEYQKRYFIQTDMRCGLRYEDTKKAIKILNGESIEE